MNGSQRTRKPLSYWEERIAQFERSGLSGLAYCRQEGLNYKTFSSWRKKLTSKAASQPGLFAKVIPKKPTAPASPGVKGVRVSLPNGVFIEMPVLPDPTWLREVGGVW